MQPCRSVWHSVDLFDAKQKQDPYQTRLRHELFTCLTAYLKKHVRVIRVGANRRAFHHNITFDPYVMICSCQRVFAQSVSRGCTAGDLPMSHSDRPRDQHGPLHAAGADQYAVCVRCKTCQRNLC